MMNFLKKWIIATRPWALPASVMPLALGTVAAATQADSFHLARFLWALLGMICLHSGANIISDIFDFRKGLDPQITPTSGALPRGLLTVRQMWVWAFVLLATGSMIGVYLALTISLKILWLGIIGILVGCSYSWLKYRALGDWVVFINFALLGTLGGWIVQTARFSWLPLVWSVPLGLLIVAILQANNWRDVEGDKACGIQTAASRMGHNASFRYYVLLLLLAPATAGAFGQPLTTLLVLLALPKIIALWKTARQYHRTHEPEWVIDLDGRTAQLNLIFGLLYIIGVAVG